MVVLVLGRRIEDGSRCYLKLSHPEMSLHHWSESLAPLGTFPVGLPGSFKDPNLRWVLVYKLKTVHNDSDRVPHVFKIGLKVIM